MKQFKLGQSLVEVVVSIGIVGLVVTGMVMLMTTALGSKTKGFDRNKAVEMSEVVMEQIINEKNINQDQFWDSGSDYWQSKGVQGLTLANYPGYSYDVAFDTTINGCPLIGCGEVKVTIHWLSSSDTAVFTRLFTRHQ